jgi:hypothetical protein
MKGVVAMKVSRNIIWLCLFIVGALAGCSGSSGGTNVEQDQGPDKVQIQVFEVDQKAPAKTVTFSQADQVQQFYQTINATSPYPENPVCTMELGPHYILTFSQAGKNMLTVTAERYGCQKLTLGKNNLRQGNQQFWQQMDQLITKAS